MISFTFLGGVDIIYHWLKLLIMWPEREQLEKTTSMTFRKCCYYIEIFLVERPPAREKIFSSYEHHSTITQYGCCVYCILQDACQCCIREIGWK